MEQKPYVEQAHEGLEQTRAHAAEAVKSAAETGSSFVDNQRRLFAVEIDGYACALHEAARQLHDQSQDRVGDYTERFASSLDSLAYNLRERDIRDSFDRFSDFARRQPMLFAGGAVAFGFLLTRFVKSSSHEGYEHESGGTFKEKVASGVEKAKEKVGAGKEKMSEQVHSEEYHAAEPPHESHTAADVEIPVILKPHDPGHPDRPV